MQQLIRKLIFQSYPESMWIIRLGYQLYKAMGPLDH